MSAGSDKKPLASPGNFFLGRKRRVTKLFAELLGRAFLPFPHFAAVDHHIMPIACSLDLDFAKFEREHLDHLLDRRSRAVNPFQRPQVRPEPTMPPLPP